MCHNYMDRQLRHRAQVFLHIQLRAKHSTHRLIDPPKSKGMPPEISPPPTKRLKVSHNSIPSFEHPSPSLPPPPPGPNTLRVFSWNINGITPFLQNQKSITTYFQATKSSERERQGEGRTTQASLRDFLRRHHWPAILFLQEVKISDTDEKTQDAVRRAVNARDPAEKGAKGPYYNVHFTLPTDKHNARGLGGKGKLYGVCSIIRSDLPSLFGVELQVNERTVEWDKEGRISVVELLSQNTSSETVLKLAVFNIYAINGTDNAYRDPQTGAIAGTRHDRKLEFHRQLMEECLTLEEDGWSVVLAGDMNVAPARIDGYPNLRTFPYQHVLNRADFRYKFFGGHMDRAVSVEEKEQEKKKDQTWQGVDIWRAMNPDIRRFTWFSRTGEWGRSCDRVDYFLTSKKLWDRGYIAGAGMMDNEAERGPSDHVPIWVDIRVSPPLSGDGYRDRDEE